MGLNQGELACYHLATILRPCMRATLHHADKYILRAKDCMGALGSERTGRIRGKDTAKISSFAKELSRTEPLPRVQLVRKRPLFHHQQFPARNKISSLESVEIHSARQLITTEDSLVIPRLLLLVHDLSYLLAESVVHCECDE